MLLYATSLISGIALLVWGADRMVIGASVTARNMGVSPMLVGLTVVGFATSAPEIVVSIMAALDGLPNLAIGNAIGSNIANIGLIGGVTALFWPLRVESQTLRREFPVIVAVSILPVILIPDQQLSRLDGLILLCSFAGFFYWIIQLGIRTRGHDAIEAEYASEIRADMTQRLAVFWIIVGLVVLIGGSKALVWGAENIARELDISDTVLGITVVAVGTSLPEMAVSIMAARKGESGFRQHHRLEQLQHAGGYRRCNRDSPGGTGYRNPQTAFPGHAGFYGCHILHGVQLHGNHSPQSRGRCRPADWLHCLSNDCHYRDIVNP